MVYGLSQPGLRLVKEINWLFGIVRLLSKGIGLMNLRLVEFLNILDLLNFLLRNAHGCSLIHLRGVVGDLIIW